MVVALIVIDMQEHFRAISKPILPRIQTVVQECHYQHVPIIYTQHGHKAPESDQGALARKWGAGGFIHHGSEAWRLQSELKVSPEKGDVLVEKDRYNAFHGTQLEEVLRERGVTCVAITGVLTNLCCESTARAAFDRDFDVLLLKDATAAEDAHMQAATEANIAYGFGRVLDTQEFLGELESLAKGPPPS